MRLAIADPPYFGCCGLYGHHHEAPFGCWDDIAAHRKLIRRLRQDFDGYAIHTSSVALPDLIEKAALCQDGYDERIMAWVKPFAAFKRNVSVAYAWEPVIVKPCRKPVVAHRMVMRDWIGESITMQRGLTGAKPERVSMWLFEMLGMEPGDEFVDLFPGSGAITRAHEKWLGQFDFAFSSPAVPSETEPHA